MIALNKQLDQKIAMKAANFNDVLIYCKKTMEKQEEQVSVIFFALSILRKFIKYFTY